MTTKFAWAAVSPATARALLLAAHGSGTWTDSELASQLRSAYGSPPQAAKLENCNAWEVLREQWALREASKDELASLVSYLMASLRVDERLDAKSTWANLRAFTETRYWTPAFKTNLRAAFVAAHKITVPASTTRGSSRSLRQGPTRLVGESAAARRDPYPHKVVASQALDALMNRSKVDERCGLIVLPTGAGKTETVVDWLVPRMTANPDLRVLWLAHRHELLEQAAQAFRSSAAREEDGFCKKLRIISAGSATSTLVEEDLDVALVTWQSLHHNWEQQRARVRRFLKRPTVVVVDEAHHSAAPAYQDILTDIRKRPDVALLGLTATPWPTQAGAGRRLRSTFPVEILTRTPEQMHEQGILALPVFHTVDTGVNLELTAEELAKSKGDLAPVVLKHLVNDARDDLLVRTWTARRSSWGKTLVFATSRDHADRLGGKLEAVGARVTVAHSTSAIHVTDALAWFREIKHPAVLVSVGMLTEGVDVPDARTAFLARPTTSRILMRQMIGRVLRGEGAGGEATANIVYFRDHWRNFDDVIEPSELPGFGGRVGKIPESGVERLPPVLDASGAEIDEDVLAQIRRMYSTRLAGLPLGPATTATVLVGYYALDDLHVPVMEHQQDTYDALIKKAIAGKSFTGAPALSMFNTDPPPYPTQRAVRAVVNHVKTHQSAPVFVPIKAQVSSLAVARRLRDEPAMTDAVRDEWLRTQFESSLARLTYESFEHFEEAVDCELRELRRSQHGRRLNPERLEPRHPRKTLPKLIQSTSRALPTPSSVANAMNQHLAGEAVLEHLDLSDLPEVGWTARVGSKNWPSAWAYWTMKTTGQLKGHGVIRVHRALRAPRTQVSDAVLEFLVFHEMLHHLLPGQGHSAEFRRLERRWPAADNLDLALDTLHEHYRLPTPGE
jgi:superfamily II DNA or RNA helicase